MRRTLPTTLLLLLAGCASTPAPTVQNAPPPRAPDEPPVAAAPAAPADAGASLTALPEVPDAAAPTAAAPTPDAGSTVAATTPATTPATTRPAATATTPAAHGRVIFQRICLRCHQDNDPDGPTPDKRWAEARMRALIRNGNARMRAIPVARLSEEDLTVLVGYLRSTRAIQ